MSDYNGWKNHATWNVALWLGNDESLYRIVTAYVRTRVNPTWADLSARLDASYAPATPDGVRWLDDDIDEDAINEMLATWLD